MRTAGSIEAAAPSAGGGKPAETSDAGSRVAPIPSAGRERHVTTLFQPSPILLSDFTAVRREATRARTARNERFDAEFDDDTLFFDAFRAPNSDQVVLVGPPFFNLRHAFDGLVVRDASGGPALPARVRHLDRHAQIWVSAAPAMTDLVLETRLGPIEVQIGENRSDLFAGRRVLLTRSRNNPLPWILDWIRFNRDVNGAEAVLFYDNASSLYSPEMLENAIAGVAGIERSVVVRWPFKYGPQGHDATSFWDSDFCELGAWEHARWRFLARARSVSTSDIDELTLGRQSAFAAAETSLLGLARYYGRWVVGIEGEASGKARELAHRRHLDYGIVLREQRGRGRFGLPVDHRRCSAKWTVVPSRCPSRAQWKMHSIAGWAASVLTRRDMGFRHFRPINTSWKYERDDFAAFDPTLHVRDDALAAAFAKVDWSR